MLPSVWGWLPPRPLYAPLWLLLPWISYMLTLQALRPLWSQINHLESPTSWHSKTTSQSMCWCLWALVRLQKLLLNFYMEVTSLSLGPWPGSWVIEVLASRVDFLSTLGALDDKIKLPILQVHEFTGRPQATVQDDGLFPLKHICRLYGHTKIQNSAIGDTTILKFPWGNHHRRWTSQRDRSYNPQKPETSTSQTTSCRPPWFIKLFARSQGNHILAWIPWLYSSAFYKLPDIPEFSNSNCKQPLSQQLRQKVGLVHLSKFATDIFHFQNCSYLIVVDYYFQLPVIYRLYRMTAKHVKAICKLFSKSMDGQTFWYLIIVHVQCHRAQPSNGRHAHAQHNKLTILPSI